MNVVIQPYQIVETALVVSLLCLGATAARAQDPAVLMDQADQSERRGDVEAALRFYGEVVSQFPDDERAPVALLRVAEGRWATGAAEVAVEAVRRLREDYSNAPSAAGAYLLEGVMQLAAATGPDDLREAWNTFGSVTALFDRNRYPEARWRREARMRRGYVAVLLGDLDLAASELLAVIEDEPLSDETAEAQFELATVLLYQGRRTEAAEIFQRVVVRLSKPEAGTDQDGTPFDYVWNGDATPLVEGLPLFKPPYGRITAIDMTTGEHVWQIANGDGPRQADPIKHLDLPPLGTRVLNFPILTETLLFTATGRDAWNPSLLNVYDKTSGELLRAIELPSSVRALPMTYLHDGKQYLAVGIGSGRDQDEIVALAIP